MVVVPGPALVAVLATSPAPGVGARADGFEDGKPSRCHPQSRGPEPFDVLHVPETSPKHERIKETNTTLIRAIRELCHHVSRWLWTVGTSAPSPRPRSDLSGLGPPRQGSRAGADAGPVAVGAEMGVVGHRTDPFRMDGGCPEVPLLPDRRHVRLPRRSAGQGHHSPVPAARRWPSGVHRHAGCQGKEFPPGLTPVHPGWRPRLHRHQAGSRHVRDLAARQGPAAVLAAGHHRPGESPRPSGMAPGWAGRLRLGQGVALGQAPRPGPAGRVGVLAQVQLAGLATQPGPGRLSCCWRMSRYLQPSRTLGSMWPPSSHSFQA